MVFTPSILALSMGFQTEAVDLSISNVEVTQATQTPGNTIQLVASRSTAVRATIVVAGSAVAVSGVTGRLRVFVNGIEVTPPGGVAPINAPFTAPLGPNRANQNDTLNFELPSPSPLSASSDVDFQVTVDPVPGETNLANNTGSANNLTVVNRNTPFLFFTRINYTPSGLGAPTDALIQRGVGDMMVRGILPVNDSDPLLYRQGLFPSLTFTEDANGDGVLDADCLDAGGCPDGNDLMNLLASCRQLIVDSGLGADNRVFLYGWLAGNPIDGNGLGQVGGRNAFGNTAVGRYQRSYAHELTHNFGFNHIANNIDQVGWDVGGRLQNNPAGNGIPAAGRVKPTTLFDIQVPGLMTPQAWVETAKYTTLFSDPTLTGPDSPDKRDVAERVLVVQGVFDPSGTRLLKLEPSFRFPWRSQPSSLQPGREQPYLARVTDSKGTVVSIPFSAGLGDDGEGGREGIGFFEVMVPVAANREAASLIITDAAGRNVFAEQGRSLPPEIEVLAPVRGSVLGEITEIKWSVKDPDTKETDLQYQIAYSPDDGRSWTPIAVDIPGSQTSLIFNSTEIQATPGKGRFRVFVSDGLNTAFADTVGLKTDAAKYPGPVVLTVGPGFTAIGNNFFHRDSDTVATILPAVADGTALYRLVNGQYTVNKFDLGTWEKPNETFANGQGVWLLSPQKQEICFFGEIGEPGSAPRLAPGLYFVACRSPRACNFEQMLGYPPQIGDQVFIYEGDFREIPNAPSSTHTFGAAGWDKEPIIQPGQGVFVRLTEQRGVTQKEVADYIRDKVLGGDFGRRALWMTETALDQSHVARDRDPRLADIPFPYPRTWLVMIDEFPDANWGHQCRWIFVDDTLTQHTEPIVRDFPPRVFTQKGQGQEILFACAGVTPVGCNPTSGATVVIRPPGDVLIDRGCLHAVLVSGGAWPSANYDRYRQNLASMYHLLRDCGYRKAAIHVFYAAGAPLDLDNLDGDNNNATGSDVEGPATEAAVRARIQNLRDTLNPNRDTLFLYFSNHGVDNEGVCLWDVDANGHLDANEIYSPAELGSDTANARVCRLFMIHDQCYSGEFLPIATDGQHPNSAIYVAATADEPSWGREYLDRWEENNPATGTMNGMHADVVANGHLSSTAGSSESSAEVGNVSPCRCWILFDFTYAHAVAINGITGRATATGTFDYDRGSLRVKARIENYIPGYRRWPSSWVTLVTTSLAPLAALELDGAQNVLTLTGGELGHAVRVHSRDSFADLTTLIDVTRDGDRAVASLRTEGTADYPELVGIDSPLAYMQTPNANGGFTETGIKRLRALDGRIIETSYQADFSGLRLPLRRPQVREISMNVVEESSDFLEITLDISNTVRPAPLPPPRILVARDKAQLILRWDSPTALLEEADEVVGPWRLLAGAFSPFVTPSTAAARKFYRLRDPGEDQNLVIPLDRVGIFAPATDSGRLREALASYNLTLLTDYGDGLYTFGTESPRTRKELVELARELALKIPDLIHSSGLVVELPESKEVLIATDEFVAQFKPGIPEIQREALRVAVGADLVRPNPFNKQQFLFKVKGGAAENVLIAVERYQQSGLVEFAEPNYVVRKDMRATVPNDPLFPSQWHLNNTGQGGGTVDADIDAPEAWDFTTGSAAVRVAVIDGGFDSAHADLIPNLWTNPAEIAGNGIDDDGNTLVDDINGWNFATGNNNLAGGNHGTAVAGCVAARGNNNLGVTGSCPNCQLMLISIGNTATLFDDGLAFGYAQSQNASIITCSWGYPTGVPNFMTVQTGINNAATMGRGGLGCVIFFAMNNPNVNDCGANPDISSLPNVIAVSRSNNRDQFDLSGFGNCMDLLAPSQGGPNGTLGITTTDLTGNFGYNNNSPIGICPNPDFTTPPANARDYTACFNGTSAATPIAAGIAGLVLSVNNTLTRAQVQQLLQDSADKIEDSRGAYSLTTGFSTPPTGNATHGYGRVNAFEAVRIAAPMTSGGRGGVDVFVRDNRLDWGNTEQLSSVLMEPVRGFIPHWESVDMKVDAPPFQPAPVTSADFDAFTDENPIESVLNKVYVRVHNRGPSPATEVLVKLHWAFAGTALPGLPPDFWTAFPSDSANITIWHPIPAQTIRNLEYSGASSVRAGTDASQIVAFDFNAPALDPMAPGSSHHCLMVVVDSPQDGVAPDSRTRLILDDITPRDNNVTQKNVQVQPGGGRSAERSLFVRNPNSFGLMVILRANAPEGWKVSTDKFDFGQPFDLAAGAEELVTVRIDWPERHPAGDVVITQERVDNEKNPIMGGFTFRIGPSEP